MDRREFIAAAGSTTAVASASQASDWLMRGAVPRSRCPGRRTDCERPGARGQALFYHRHDRGLFQRSGHKFHGGCDSRRAGRSTIRPSQQIVIVRLGRALPPGTYRVSWHVVTIDQRQASGAYLFTVS